jgi:hypothetical protein
MKRNSSLIGGMVLIGLGIIFLLNYFLPATWPVILVLLGLGILVTAYFFRDRWGEGLGISGLLTLVIGAILLYQTITQDWRSWYFLWPLIFTAVGAGMLLNRWLAHERYGGARYTRISWAFIGVSLVMVVALAFVRREIYWPSIIWGIGVLFLLTAIAGGLGPLAIPGTIFGGIGLLLAWQNYTGYWDSWAFTWALIPGFVGLGLFLAFIGRRVMRVVGLSMLGWSLVVFVIFGLIFGGNGQFVRMWPFGLILAGLVIVAQALLTPRRRLVKSQ